MGGLTLAALLIGFAAYRVYRIIGMDQITEPLRAPLLARDDRQPYRWIMDLITCPWCNGWWITGAAALALGHLYGWHPVEGVMVWFAASTVCGFLGKLDLR